MPAVSMEHFPGHVIADAYAPLFEEAYAESYRKMDAARERANLVRDTALLDGHNETEALRMALEDLIWQACLTTPTQSWKP